MSADQVSWGGDFNLVVRIFYFNLKLQYHELLKSIHIFINFATSVASVIEHLWQRFVLPGSSNNEWHLFWIRWWNVTHTINFDRNLVTLTRSQLSKPVKTNRWHCHHKYSFTEAIICKQILYCVLHEFEKNIFSSNGLMWTFYVFSNAIRIFKCHTCVWQSFRGLPPLITL